MNILKFFFLIPLFIYSTISSQVDANSEKIKYDKRNNIQVELLGKGFYYSLNYERNIFTLNQLKFNSNIGFCFFPAFTSLEPSNEYLIPMEINMAYKKEQHELVFGLGTTLWKYSVNHIPINNSNLSQQPATPILNEQTEWFAHCSIEYRYHAKNIPLFYKIGYIPLFFDSLENTRFNKKINYQTSMTLGIGWSF